MRDPERSHVRSWGLLVLTLVMLGIATNIGVTVWIAVSRSHSGGPSVTTRAEITRDSGVWSVRRLDYDTMTRIYWTASPMQERGAANATDPLIPSWSRVNRDLNTRVFPPDDHLLIEVAFGWPLVSASYEYTRQGSGWTDPRSPASGAVDLGDRTVPGNARVEVVAVPLRIAWWNFIANSLMYLGAWGTLAGGLWGLLSAIGRRRRRRAAGLCEWCGYDRDGLDAAERCPECGRDAQAEPPVPDEAETV